MDGLDTFHEQLHTNRSTLVALFTKGLEEVLRDDHIAKDAFAIVNVRFVMAFQSDKPWS